MTYRLTLHDRSRMARAKRDRYRRDPDYRLQRINAARVKKGLPRVGDLSEVKVRLA